MDQTFMKEKPVLPLVLKMALPIVLSMLINSLYNIVDSYFVAQWNESAMTAVSLVFPLQNLANAVGIGFGVASTRRSPSIWERSATARPTAPPHSASF